MYVDAPNDKTDVLTKDLIKFKSINKYIYSGLEINDYFVCCGRFTLNIYSLLDFKLLREITTKYYMKTLVNLDNKSILVGGDYGFFEVIEIPFLIILTST